MTKTAEERELDARIKAAQKVVNKRLHDLRIIRKVLQEVRARKNVAPPRVDRAIKSINEIAREDCHADERERMGLGHFNERKLLFEDGK